MNDLMKNLLLWTVIALVLLGVFRSFGPTATMSAGLSYSEFLAKVEREQVSERRRQKQRPPAQHDASGDQYVVRTSKKLTGSEQTSTCDVICRRDE